MVCSYPAVCEGLIVKSWMPQRQQGSTGSAGRPGHTCEVCSRTSHGKWRLKTWLCVVCSSIICKNVNCSRTCLCGEKVCSLIECRNIHGQDHYDEEKEKVKEASSSDADRRAAADWVLACRHSLDAGLSAAPKRQA